MEIRRYGAPRDVLWLKINKRPDDPQWSMGHRGPKKNFIMIDRGDYWQCGYSIPKDSLDGLKAQGIAPFLENRGYCASATQLMRCHRLAASG